MTEGIIRPLHSRATYRDPEPFEFQTREGAPLSLREAIFQALGAASVCWSRVEFAGEFQSMRAEEIGEALLVFVREHTEEARNEAVYDTLKESDVTTQADVDPTWREDDLRNRAAQLAVTGGFPADFIQRANDVYAFLKGE